MKRAMVVFDEEKCDGCGDCIPSCAEGAIAIVDGKARLIDDRYCDGLGACLGDCPQGAISIEEREAPEFDHDAVAEHLAARRESRAVAAGAEAGPVAAPAAPAPAAAVDPTPLRQWPIKLGLLGPLVPFLRGADLVLAADCAAFAHGAFHGLLRGRPLAIACPKLDDNERSLERLAAIVRGAGIRSIHVLRMEVPCCGGLEALSRLAVERAGVDIPVTSEIIRIGPAFGGRPPVGAGCPSTIPVMR